MSNLLSDFPIGLGCMAMSGMYGPADERRASRRSTPRSTGA